MDLSIICLSLRRYILILHSKINIKQINIAMKKLLLLFAVLLSTVSGWAQTSYQPGRRTLTLEAGKKYFISAATSHGGVYTNLLYDDNGTLRFSSLKPTDITNDAAYLFTVEEVGEDDTYYIKNNSGKYLLTSSAVSTETKTAITIVPYGRDGVKGTFTCGNDVNACDANGNIIQYASITAEIPIVCAYEQYTEGTETKDRGWRGIGSFSIAKTTPFAFYEVNEDLFEVTYKFVDTEENILHTETFTASEGSALLNAHNFLKVPSNVVTLTNAPTGEASSTTTEYTITVSYNDNFPFVPTTIVDGNFAQGTKWYNMKVRHGNDRKRLKAVGDDLQENTSWNDCRDMNQYFAFTGDPLNGFYLHNKNLGGSKVFSCLVNKETAGNVDGSFTIGNGVAMELFSRNGYWQFAPIVRPTANARIHDLNGNLGYWHSSGANGDSGSDFTIFCVDVEAGIKTANFQFKENGVVRYEESATAYPGYDIKISQPLGVVPNTSLEYMPSAEGDIEVEWTLNVPFEYYSSYNEIKKWYYLKFDAGNNYFLYHQDGADHIALDRQELKIEDLESHSWAFVGNPFDGYMIYNKATGSSKILSSSTTMTGTTGADTWPVLTATPVPNGNNELWFARESSYATNGFFLEQKGHSSNKLNNRGKLAYWTDGEGPGSTFVVENAIPVRLTTDDNNPIYYALKTGRNWDSKEWWYNYTDSKISLTQFDGTDAQWWYFKGKLVDNKVCVQLVPKSDNTKCMSYANSDNGAEKIIAQQDGTTGYTNTWRFAFKDGRYVLQTSDGRNYLSNNGGRNNNGYINKMGLWSDSPESDSGTALYIYETMPFELRDNAENEYVGTFLYQLESLANPTFTGSHSLALNNIERGEKFTADVDFCIPVSKTDGSADNLLLITPFSSENTLKYYVENDNVKVSNSDLTSTNVDNYQWAIYPTLTGNEFSFVIKNHGTGKFIKTNKTESSGITNDEGAVTVVENISGATAFTLEANNRFKIPDYNLYMSVTSSGASPQSVTVHSGQNHSGVNNHFTVVSDIVNNEKSPYVGFFGYVGGYPLETEETFNSIDTYKEYLQFVETNDVLTLGAGEKFKIICKDSGRGSMVYSTVEDKGSEENVFLAGTSSAYFPSKEADGVYDEWAFVTIEGKDYLFNVQNKKFVSLQGDVLKFKENGSAFVLQSIQGPVWALKFDGTGNHYLCFSPGYESDAVRTTVDIADDGNRFYLQKTNENVGDDVLNSMSNLHYQGELDDWKTQNIAVLGYVGAYPATLQNEINAVENYSDIPAFEEEHVEDIIPLKEGYYYIKSVELSKFAVNDNDTFKATTDPVSEKSANNIFRFVSNGDGKYKFQSFANGKYVTLRDAAAAPAGSPSEIEALLGAAPSFSFERSDFAQFKIKDENDKVMRHEGSNKSYAINYWSTDVKYWYLIEASELPLTIHSTGYSTFSAAVGVDVPEGVTAYYAKDLVGDSYIRMYPVTTIPANEGVVIKGTGSATVKFPIISNAEALPAENLLKAHLNTEEVTATGSVFILGTRDDATGFYPLSETNNTIAGHKSYLEIPATQAARLSIVWDDTETSIHEAEGGEQNVEIYDLTGRRLDKPAKGVNIIGGKLVIK